MNPGEDRAVTLYIHIIFKFTFGDIVNTSLFKNIYIYKTLN